MSDVLAPRAAKADHLTLAASHMCLRVPDYEASKTWFTDKLGFRVAIEWPGPVGVKMAYLVAADDERCVIEIVGDGDAPSAVPQTTDLFASFGKGGYHHFCFTVPSVDAAVAELRRRGVTIVAEPFEVPEIDRRLAFIADPFSNLFELEEKLR